MSFTTPAKPAVPAKEFPHPWIYKLIVHAPTPTSGHLHIEKLAYDRATGEIAPSESLQVIQTQDLFGLLSDERSVKINAAFLAILDALDEAGEVIELRKIEAENLKE